MSRTFVTAAVAALTATTLVVGPATAGPAESRGATLSGPYLGTYTATLTLAQATARGDARMAGRFRLVLRANGSYTAANPLDGASSGRVTALSGRRLRFHKDAACLQGGHERSAGGVYRWSLDGKRLTLRLVSEGACTGRTQTLTYPVWVRQ